MSKNLKLYEIAAEFKELEDMLFRDGGEISDDNELQLKKIQHLLTTKIDSCYEWICQQEDYIELLKNRVKTFNANISARTNAVESFKNHAEMHLKSAKIDEIKGDFCTVKFKGKAPKLIIHDEKKIPIHFFKRETTLTVKSRELVAALKSGEYKGKAAELLKNQRRLSFDLTK